MFEFEKRMIVLVALIAGLFAAVAPAWPQSLSRDTAILVVYRADLKRHTLIKPVLAVDGKDLVQLPDKHYFQMAIPPGTYTLDVNFADHKFKKDHEPGEHGKLGAAEVVHIEPGTTCYVKLQLTLPLAFGLARLSMVRAAPDQALQELPHLRRVNPKWVRTGTVYKLEKGSE